VRRTKREKMRRSDADCPLRLACRRAVKKDTKHGQRQDLN